jgi:hypothetical protein
MRVDPSAGTRPITATAARAATTPPGVSGGARPAPTRAPGPPSQVDRLFAVVNSVSQELRGAMDGAEAARMSGPVGVDPAQVQRTLAEAKENLQSLMKAGGQAGRSAESFLRDLEDALSGSEASNAHLQQVVARQQDELAARFGFSGHLLNTWV